MAAKKQTVRKQPLRKCIGCNEMKPKRELVRVVKNKDGEISLDLTGKAQGRGAYLCNTLTCLQAARKHRGLERAFSCRIENAVYDQMEAVMKAGQSDE